jgi:hypothetical protein
MKKSQNIRVWLKKKWFWRSIFAQKAKLGKMCITAVNLLENVIINMIWLLLPVSDWPVLMICPGGLLLVVPPHPLQSQISFMCEVAKKQITKVGGAGSHTEHSWGCSKEQVKLQIYEMSRHLWEDYPFHPLRGTIIALTTVPSSNVEIWSNLVG